MATSPSWNLTVLGSRGSIPVGGEAFVRYGGHTTSCLLETPDADILIDAGSGLVEIPAERLLHERDATLLMTHLHWDHICGFPHLASLYAGHRELEIVGVPREGLSCLDGLVEAHRRPFFPVDLRAVSKVALRDTLINDSGRFERHGVTIDYMDVPHPGGATAWALNLDGRRLVFAPDIEVARLTDDRFHRFVAGAEVLVIDSHFTEEEYARCVGWGHSSNEQVARLANELEIDRLELTHHSPWRNDSQIDAMIAGARSIFPETNGARQGRVIWSSAG